MVQNSLGVSVVKVFFLGGICGSVVMPYMYNLLRYCWDLAFMYVARLIYVGLNHHFCSRRVSLWGMSSLQWWCGFRTPFLVGITFGLWAILCKLGV